ncbi:MAG: hypothetical protein C4575_02855 [Desulforudis sp.]|nr:hypothetical protein [Clostridia bacterium]MDQ7791995.1 hypothetical protein [Clostridia bacterium]RJX21918.1 MAG: hypothetical protein C4575_02855 [Desulforudis sp.]
MASARIFANEVTEETICFSAVVSGKPKFAATDLGNQFHVTIISAEAVSEPDPHVKLHYIISLEYRFKNGFDYCHIEETGSAAFPDEARQSTCRLSVIDGKATLSNIVISDGLLKCFLNIDFLVRFCSERVLNVLLAEELVT